MKFGQDLTGRLALSAAAYFLILLLVQAALGFGRGFGFDSDHLAPMFADADRLLAIFGMTDFAAYIKGARMFPVLHMRTFTGGFGMYPPGLSIIEYAVLKVWPAAPIFALLFFASLALWALFLTLLAQALQKVFLLKQRSAFLIPLVLLVFPFFTNDYLWYDVGLTECLASPLFAIGCIGSLLLFLRAPRKAWIAAVMLGLTFAAASYIRAQFDLMFMALALAAAICLVAKARGLGPQILAFLLLFGTYQAATIPYKLFKHAPTIVTMDDYAWGQVWTKQEDAEKYHVYVQHGMQSICEINMPQCQDFTDRRNRGEAIDYHEYKSAALSTVLHRPLALLKFKLPIFWSHFLVEMFEPVAAPGSYRYLSDCLLALGISLTAIYTLIRYRRIGLAYTLFAAAFVSSCLLFSLLIHIEPRYFLPIKLLAAVSLIFVAVDAAARRRKPA